MDLSTPKTPAVIHPGDELARQYAIAVPSVSETFTRVADYRTRGRMNEA
jgi:hypothetical protein